MKQLGQVQITILDTMNDTILIMMHSWHITEVLLMLCFTSVLQELQVEKQKTGRVEAMMREQVAAMEKELGSMQAKAQGSYQELQTMQIKVKIVRISFQHSSNTIHTDFKNPVLVFTFH